MTTVKLTLPTTFSDSNLPVLADDPMISLGTLLLIDPAHSSAPLPGLPIPGSRIPNLATPQARAILGTGAEVRPAWQVGSTFDMGSDGFIERTAKGGLHGASKNPMDSSDAGKGFGFGLPDAIASWIQTNPSHLYYMSVWGRITRISGETNPPGMMAVAAIIQKGKPTQSYLNRLSISITRPIGGSAGAIGARPADFTGIPDSLAPFLTNIGTSAWTGTPPTDLSTSRVASWGMCDVIGSVQAASWILYRTYLEDLTVSGRTYAAVDALDQEMYTTAVTTPGGRYYGDTWTDPATIDA